MMTDDELHACIVRLGLDKSGSYREPPMPYIFEEDAEMQEFRRRYITPAVEHGMRESAKRIYNT